MHVEPQGGEAATSRARPRGRAHRLARARDPQPQAFWTWTGESRCRSTSSCPGDLSLDQAHDIAEQVEAAIVTQVAEVHSVQTHLEPIRETASAEELDVDTAAIEAAVREEIGTGPRELRLVRTDDGIVVFLTLGLGGAESLADAHGRASAIEERVRSAVPAIADVVVHTEP